MHSYYVINGITEFYPVTGKLKNTNSKEIVFLNSPAGRCLLLLIEQAGSIVTQQEFMEIVWEKKGMQVSPNTFYQNISILRKGLNKVDLPDIVITIPRIGLTLASGAQITKKTNQVSVDVSHQNAQYIDEQFFSQETEILQQFEKGNCANEKNMSDKQLPTRMILTSLMRGIIFITIALMTVLTLVCYGNNGHQYFSNHHFFKSSHGCRIFLSYEIISDEARLKALERSNQFFSRCKNYPWIYVTYFPLLPRMSIIRCDKPMRENNICISDYYFESN